MTVRVVVLVSGTGTLLQSLIDNLPEEVTIVAVGSDQPGAVALQRAEKAGIPTFAEPLPRADADQRVTMREAWDARLTDDVSRFDPDLVVCAGFMKLLGTTFLDRFGGRTINSHPALLPSFPGIHGPRDALDYGVKITGATVFVVDAGVDTGRILAQRAVPVRPTTPSSPSMNVSRWRNERCSSKSSQNLPGLAPVRKNSAPNRPGRIHSE